MYGTDFREEALKHVIESLDPALFERVTGLTIEDFKLLSDLGLFNARNMDARDLPVQAVRAVEPSLCRRPISARRSTAAWAFGIGALTY